MSLLIAVLLSCLVPIVLAQSRFVFGPFYGWRYPEVKSYITLAETTLCPGNTPYPEAQRASMWMGMEAKSPKSGRRELIQAIIVSDPYLYRRFIEILLAISERTRADLEPVGNVMLQLENGVRSLECCLIS
jgi:hypothetical protein